MKLFTLPLPLWLGCRLLAAAAPPTDLYFVRDCGAKGDGKTDDTGHNHRHYEFGDKTGRQRLH